MLSTVQSYSSVGNTNFKVNSFPCLHQERASSSPASNCEGKIKEIFFYPYHSSCCFYDEIYDRTPGFAKSMRGMIWPNKFTKNIDVLKAFDAESILSPFSFEGGNVRCADGFMYIGSDTVSFNRDILAIKSGSEQEVFDGVNRMSDWFQSQVVMFGDASLVLSKQPIKHIDLFCTFLGGRKVVVGDVNYAIDIITKRKDWESILMSSVFDIDRLVHKQQMGNEDFYSYSPFNAIDPISFKRNPTAVKTYVAFLAYILRQYRNRYIYRQRDADFKEIWDDGSLGEGELSVEEGLKMFSLPFSDETIKDILGGYNNAAVYMDSVATQLRQSGYEVFRCPLLPHIPRLLNGIGREMKAPLITYNNALVECYDSNRIVYMPEYGLKFPTVNYNGYVVGNVLNELDIEARHVFERAGAVVRGINTGFNLTTLQSQVNCMTLERREAFNPDYSR